MAGRITRRALLTAGVVGPPLFVAVFLVEGATRDGYEWVRHPVSSLALGPWGWVQTLNFLVTGVLLLAGSIGLWRDGDPAVRTRAGRALLTLNAAGLFLAGVFTTDPVSGYPPGTPVTIDYTARGALHDVASLPTFIGLPIAAFCFARSFRKAGERAWAHASAVAGAAVLVFFVLASQAFAQSAALVDHGGFYQRVAILFGLGWLAAVHYRQRQRV